MKKISRILKRQEKLLKEEFSDLLKVYRVIATKTDIGETKLVKELIYSDIPCYLSTSKEKVSAGDSIISVASNEYLVFLARGIDIIANDYIEIEKEGMMYKGRISKPYLYDTHIELSFLGEEVE